MGHPKLWISFHKQDGEIDHWALYLDFESESDCEVWQASGQTFEFESTHIRGMRPDAVPNFKEKWLIKDSMTTNETKLLRRIAGKHPVDNDGAYWDCRVFCFEIMGSLEAKDVLKRSDQDYRDVRKRLHEKWMSDDGVSVVDSDSDSDSDSDIDTEEEPDQTPVDDSELENDSPDEKTMKDGPSKKYKPQIKMKAQKFDDCNPTSTGPSKR